MIPLKVQQIILQLLQEVLIKMHRKILLLMTMLTFIKLIKVQIQMNSLILTQMKLQMDLQMGM